MEVTSFTVIREEIDSFDALCHKMGITRSGALRAFVRAALSNNNVLKLVLESRDYVAAGRPRKRQVG